MNFEINIPLDIQYKIRHRACTAFDLYSTHEFDATKYSMIFYMDKIGEFYLWDVNCKWIHRSNDTKRNEFNLVKIVWLVRINIASIKIHIEDGNRYKFNYR